MANGDTNDNQRRHEVSRGRLTNAPTEDWFREFDRSQVPHVSVAQLAWTLGFFAATAIASIFAFVSLLAANSAFENQRDEVNNFGKGLSGRTPVGKWLDAENAYISSRNMLLLGIAILVIAVSIFFYEAYRAARCLSPGRPPHDWTNATIAFFMWKRTEQIDQIACSKRVNGVATQSAESNFGLVLGRIWWALNVGFWIFLIAAFAVGGDNSRSSLTEVFPDPGAFVADFVIGSIAFLISIISCVVGAIYLGNMATRVSESAMQQSWDDNRAAHTTPRPINTTESRADQSSTRKTEGTAGSQFSTHEEARQRRVSESREQANQIAALSLRDRVLFDDLKVWRSETARNADVPSFVVCTDHTLLEICKQKPKTLDELLQVQGMGEIKVAKFGDAILSIIND